MAEKKAEKKDDVKNKATSTTKPKPAAKKTSKEIHGDLAYVASYGVLKKFLDIATDAARPEIVNYEYLESKQMTGGSAKAVPPLLKKMHFLDSGGRPTETYAKFQTQSSRSHAALSGLKNAFKSVFDRNRYAHTLSQDKVKDIVIEITGLEKNSSTLRAIMGTFNSIKSFIKVSDLEKTSDEEVKNSAPSREEDNLQKQQISPDNLGIGLRYNINVVLPDTSDITVYNAIFKSIKENLL